MSAAKDLINELKIFLVESSPLSEGHQEGFQEFLTERRQQKSGEHRAADYLALLFTMPRVTDERQQLRGLTLLKAQDDEGLQRFLNSRLPKKVQKRRLARAMGASLTASNVSKRVRTMRAVLTMAGPLTAKALFKNTKARRIAMGALEAAWAKDSTEALSILGALPLKSQKIRSWVRSVAGMSGEESGKPYEVGVQGGTAAVPTGTRRSAARHTRDLSRKLSSRALSGLTKAKTRFASLPKAERETKRTKYLSKMAGTLEKLQLAIDKGVLTGTLREHVRAAKAYIDKHAENFQPSVERMTGAIHDAGVIDIEVTARTKALESALGKIVKKPKYKSVDRLQDGTGIRVVCKSVQDVKKAVAAVKAQYTVVGEDDYIDTPQGDYRSFHLIVRDKDGLDKEVQIRTANQHTWAEWYHDVYKPMTPAQLESVELHADTLDDYAGKVSEYFWQVDQGKDPGAMPPCPQVVANSPFGCMT